jgi:F-type H+-transporting ATPase subunit b
VLIDWVTVVAQIINFLILVYLLKRFLYGPIVRAMNEREERIRAEIEDAERARAEAETRTAELERARRELERDREELMDRARKEVLAWKDDALERTRSEVEHARQAWMEGLSIEQERTRQRVRRTIADNVMAVSRKVLADLANGSLERAAVEQFLDRLGEARREGGDSEPLHGEVIVELGFDGEEQRERVRSGLGELFGDGQAIRVTANPELGFGIRVLAGDQKWEWNLARYLQELERTMFDRLTALAGGAGR